MTSAISLCVEAGHAVCPIGPGKRVLLAEDTGFSGTVMCSILNLLNLRCLCNFQVLTSCGRWIIVDRDKTDTS